MQPMPVERTIFQDGVVTITTARAILGDTTYAMANITSVRATREYRSVLLVVLGGLTAIGGLIAGFDGSPGGGFLTTCLGSAVATFYFWPAPKNWVLIGTSGAEKNAIWSRDPNWTAAVVGAINQAIVSRG